MQLLSSFLVPCAYLSLVAVSFYGWGAAIVNMGLRDFKLGPGLRLAFGFGFFLIMAGWIELTKTGSHFVLFLFLAVGFILFVRHAVGAQNGRRKKFVRGLWASIVFVPIWFVFLSLEFNYHDDFQGYLIFPLRIFAEGFQGADLLNDRRIASGGAGSYLNALFLATLPIETVRIADLGVGFILMLLLAYEHSGRWIIGLVSAAFLAIYTPFANISPTYSGAAMGYALFLFSFRTLEMRTDRRYIFWGLLAGALASLKANFTFPIAILAVIEILLLALKDLTIPLIPSQLKALNPG